MGIKNINDLPILTEKGENTKVLVTDKGEAKLFNVNLLNDKKDLEPVFYISDDSSFTNEDGSQISKTEFERNVLNGVAYILCAPSFNDVFDVLNGYHNNKNLIDMLQNKHIYCYNINGFVNYGTELRVTTANDARPISQFNFKD